MGQSTSSCFEDDSGKSEVDSRNAFHPLSSQDAERTRFQQKEISSETEVSNKHKPLSVKSSNTSSNITHKKTGDDQKVSQSNYTNAWDNIPSLQEEDKNKSFDSFIKGKDTSMIKAPRKSEYISSTTNDSTHGRKSKPKRVRLRWKYKDPMESSKCTSHGIMTLMDVPNQKTFYFFANGKSSTNAFRNICETALDIGSERTSGIIEYTGKEATKTKLEMKDEIYVKNALLKKMRSRSKKEAYIEPILVCGTQIYTRRVRLNNISHDSCLNESVQNFTLSPMKSSKITNSALLSIEDVNPDRTFSVSDETLREIIKKKRQFDKTNASIQNEGRQQSRFKGKKVLEPRGATLSYNNQPTQKGVLLSATVEDGVARKIYTPGAILESKTEAVPEMVCVCSKHDIYVCDLGLTSSRCDFIVNIAEQCSNGNYNAYTYAKQTLGCREFDELAVVCEWPVMRAVVSIHEHLEKTLLHRSKVKESAPPFNSKSKRRTLVLDDREPHIVKYDVSRKERQKLDMHTDKSEWTFLIALTDGTGDDYEGGGTFFECINATVHLEKGHALIFPGRLRHRGQKIISGNRYLLVGFLVEKHK